jgi:hypothetical protein
MDLELCQMNIDTAFPYAPFKEDVYIRQPIGLEDGSAKVCHLKCHLYILKHPPFEFNTLLRDWLVDQGWTQCISDPCIYNFRTCHIFSMIAMYVYDIPTACNDTFKMHAFNITLCERFLIKDLGDLSQMLGMHITRDKTAHTISMDQSKWVKNILIERHMADKDVKPSSLPMEPGFLSGLAPVDSPLLTEVAKDVYPSMMGSLHYTAVCTRPDVSTTLSILGNDQAIPTEAHLQALKKVVRNLKGTIELRETLGRGIDQNLQLTGFADVDLANDSRQRKSQSGCMFILSRGPVS